MKVFNPRALAEARYEKGWSLAMTARLLGFRLSTHVCRTTIYAWEHGKTSPKLIQFFGLCDLFKCDPLCLLEENYDGEENQLRS